MVRRPGVRTQETHEEITIMPTFERCDTEVDRMAKQILAKFETHKPLLECGATIDFVFAYADLDDKTGHPVNDALTKNGVKALGIAKVVAPKDRALGRKDAEIALDGDWWKEAQTDQQEALLDHEIHHLVPKTSKGALVRDDKGRPMLTLRKHDYEFGFFTVIARRHGRASQEVIQAKALMDRDGQAYWPDIFGEAGSSVEGSTVTIESDGKSVTVPLTRFSQIAKEMKAKK